MAGVHGIALSLVLERELTDIVARPRTSHSDWSIYIRSLVLTAPEIMDYAGAILLAFLYFYEVSTSSRILRSS